MRILPALAAACLLAAPLALPASAHATVATQSADPQAEARIQAAADRFSTLIADLDTHAAVIREDESLTPEQRESRILALIAPHQAEIDTFIAALVQYTIDTAEPDEREEIEASADMVSMILQSTIIRALVEGPDAQ
jgi:hypothetical protein